MALLDLTPDELLTTTRAVRKRLDMERPVARHLIEECLEIALQAPTGSNVQGWHFVVVTDAGKKQELAGFYRKGMEVYASAPSRKSSGDEAYDKTMARVMDSAQYLAQVMHEAPVLLVPCIFGRTDGSPAWVQASTWGSIYPAVWNFMLAARARGLGTCLTTLHLMEEEKAAEVLGIPFAKVMQAGLLPVAHTKGTDFKPAPRRDADRVIHWDAWKA